jgi:hypothetical protein
MCISHITCSPRSRLRGTGRSLLRFRWWWRRSTHGSRTTIKQASGWSALGLACRRSQLRLCGACADSISNSTRTVSTSTTSPFRIRVQSRSCCGEVTSCFSAFSGLRHRLWSLVPRPQAAAWAPQLFLHLRRCAKSPLVSTS